MDVGVADAAELDIDSNVVRPGLAALERERFEGCTRGTRGVAVGFDHRLHTSGWKGGCRRRLHAEAPRLLSCASMTMLSWGIGMLGDIQAGKEYNRRR